MRNPYANTPLAQEQLDAWEQESLIAYRQMLERSGTRPVPLHAQVEAKHAARILALAAEVRRLRDGSNGR